MLITFHNVLEYSRYFSDMGDVWIAAFVLECLSKSRPPTIEEYNKAECPQPEVLISSKVSVSAFSENLSGLLSYLLFFSPRWSLMKLWHDWGLSLLSSRALALEVWFLIWRTDVLSQSSTLMCLVSLVLIEKKKKFSSQYLVSLSITDKLLTVKLQHNYYFWIIGHWNLDLNY